MKNRAGNILILTSVLGVSCVVMSLATSCPYQVNDCKCSNSSLVCSSLRTIPELKTGSNVTGITSLIFERGFIDSVPDNSLPPGLIVLKFLQNPLVNISTDAFLASETTLKELVISDGRLQKLPDALLKLANLTSLVIFSNPIEIWDSDILQHTATSLSEFQVASIGLSMWPKWFSFFQALTKVGFTGDSIKNVPDDAFSSLTDTLTELSLSNCSLTQVPKALSILRKLTALDLSGNIIADVDTRPGIELLASFSCANTLKILSLAFTKLTVIPNLSNMTSLHTLVVKGNDINDVVRNMFPPNLTILDLTFNKITTISNTSFSSCPLLEELYLAFNPILVVSWLAFRNIGFLRVIELNNVTNDLIPFALTSLTRLTSLRLSDTLDCQCVVRQFEIQLWYNAYNGTLNVSGGCVNGLGVNDFLSGQCPTPLTITSTTDDAVTLLRSNICIYSCVITLIVFLYSL